MSNPFIARRIEEIRKKLARWEYELPKLVQPEREHVQNFHDVTFLLNLVKKQDEEIEKLKNDLEEAHYEGMGEDL